MKDLIPTKMICSFFDKINKTKTCWLWTAATNGKYGVIGQNGKNRFYAHRFSFIIHKGEIPDHFCVLHKCDTPLCVNPKHLFVGTHKDNVDDKIKKGRDLVREKHPMAKLTWKEVAEIRNLYSLGSLTQREIAKIYGVTRKNISRITTSKTWQEENH